MKLDAIVLKRFDELISDGQNVLKTMKPPPSNSIGFPNTVDAQLSNKWGISSLNLLERVFGNGSVYYTHFSTLYEDLYRYTVARKALGILQGAKEDYEHGYLFKTKLLIEAEVFDEFLEQAEYLLQQGYFAPAAVIAGSVLEDALRKLCIRNGVTLPDKPKLDTMNAELAKAGAYTKLVQKNVTALADIRNSAAHGKWDEFTESDVKNMIVQVRSFMTTSY